MGNKPANLIYKELTEEFYPEKTIAGNLSLTALSEPEIIAFLFDIINKKLKDSEMQSSFNLNITSSEEENQGVDTKDLCLKNLLVAGHEEKKEIESEFKYMEVENAVAPGLKNVQDYSQERTAEFIVSVLMMLERVGGEGEAVSFYERIGNYLLKSIEDKPEETSAALYFAALLIDPKKLLTDAQLLESVLNMFTTITSLSFYGWTKENLIIDRSIEYIKRSLLTEIESLSVKKDAIFGMNLEKAIRTLCYIGLARGSIEDLLIVVDLIKKLGITIDLTDILKKILSLPEIDTKPFRLQSSALNYSIPFEKIYMDKSSWITDQAMPISSVSDGEYVYFYSATHGLIVLRAGEGRIYKCKGFIDCKGRVQLLLINKVFYCWNEGKLLKLDIETMELKEAKEVPCTAKDKITATEDWLVVYSETGKEESEESENPRIHADIVIHDLNTEVKKYSITHSVNDINNITLYKNAIILANTKRYEVIDLSKNIIIKKEESDLLKQATICCHQESNKLFILYSVSNSEGFALGQLNLIHLQEQTPPFISAKINQLRQTVGTTENKNLVSKHELSSLLGIFINPEETKEEKSVGIESKVEDILAALAYRSNKAESFMITANLKDPKEIMQIYKSPLAIHLTAKCLETLFKLIQSFFNDFIERKKGLESLCYLMIILSEHLVALGKCNVSLEDCVGPEGIKEFDKINKEIILPIINNALDEIEDRNLVNTIKQFAILCKKYSSSLGKPDIEQTFNLLHKSLKEYVEEKKIEDNLEGLINWLSISENLEALTNRILNADKNYVELLDMYFSIEVNYFSQIIRKLPTQNIYKTISRSFSKVIEKCFISVWSQMRKKDNQVLEFIINILPNLLHKHLKRVIEDIKSSYKGKTNKEYVKYWKLIDNLLKNDMHLLHCYFMLTTMILGLNLHPSQAIFLARILMKSADELKDICKENHSSSSTQEEFKSIISGTMNTEVEYKFPESSEIHVLTVDDIDIPPPDKNEIIIYEIPKNKPVITLTRANTSCNRTIRSSHIKISAKIEYPNKNDKPHYNGYHLRIIPKVISCE